MNRFDVILMVIIAALMGLLGGHFYATAQLDVARMQALQECQLRNQIYDTALETLTKDKWRKWDVLFDAAKKAERKEPR